MQLQLRLYLGCSVHVSKEAEEAIEAAQKKKVITFHLHAHVLLQIAGRKAPSTLLQVHLK